MAPRKTVDLESLVNTANLLFASDIGNADTRRGVAMLLEDALTRANAYDGFVFLEPGEVPHNAEYGIKWENDSPTFGDQTRRRYSFKRK